MISFKTYSFLSVLTTAAVILRTTTLHRNFFDSVVILTHEKINLVIIFNFIVVILMNFGNLMIWMFFNEIRMIESKYIMDKSKKKMFTFMLLCLILRSTFDFYKFITLAILLFFWCIHWMVYKRSDYLISRGSRHALEHGKLLVLFSMLCVVDFFISFLFYEDFTKEGVQLGEIYVVVGFEFVRLFLKAIEDSFKYIISLLELWNREQWTEKGFVFNIIAFFFGLVALALNIKLFHYIIYRRHGVPLYLLGEIIDNIVKLYKSLQLFYNGRQLINKLKRLPDINGEDLADSTCIICLEEINKAKKLKCGHAFHLNCLRRWLEENVACPTCRENIELDDAPAAQAQQQQAAQQRVRAQRVRRYRPENQENQAVQEQPNEEEKKQDNQEETKKVEPTQDVKKTLEVDEDELFDSLEADHLLQYAEDQADMLDALHTELKKSMKPDINIQEEEQTEQKPVYMGSTEISAIPFGLPCLAVTRKSARNHVERRKIMLRNEKLVKIMKLPGNHVSFE